MADVNETILNFDAYRQPWTFTVLLIVVILALVSTLSTTAFFFSHWKSMITKALCHHTVFLLTVTSFLYTAFDLPLSLNYFRIGYHPYRSIPFCIGWYWYDYSLLMISRCVVATASIQRHILVFRSQWLQTKRKRWILHYMPLIFSIVCPPIFYFVLMYFYSCTVYFDYAEGWCTYPCYIDNTILFNVDWFVSTILPVFLIVVANAALLIRVFQSTKRIRRQQAAGWKRQKRLTLQLFAYSSLYLLTWLPMTIVALLHVLVFPNLYNDIPNLYYIFHLSYFVLPLQSFLCIFALPELIDFIQRRARQLVIRSTVAPTTTLRPTPQRAIVPAEYRH